MRQVAILVYAQTTMRPWIADGVMQQFAISEATLLAWTSMDAESMSVGSNQGSVAQLSEINQESVTSRDQILRHSSVDGWPHTYVSQGLYCLSSSDAWEPMSNEQSNMASPAAGSYVMGASQNYDENSAYLHQHLQQMQVTIQSLPSRPTQAMHCPADQHKSQTIEKERSVNMGE
ncbi:Protein FAM131B [Acipenser ruthenus]|uniref:Protein FAM131B n=1 Tax=Acipenser ruthenus TaxID=7906 RepID=A0A444UUU1_ACIRT|nr:Protein FAM131B [Acipenser ruthenus]